MKATAAKRAGDPPANRPSGSDRRSLLGSCGYHWQWVDTRPLGVHPYLFFISTTRLPNRSLTRNALNPSPVSTGDPDMSDLIFIALGGGTLLVLALYARALDRL